MAQLSQLTPTHFASELVQAFASRFLTFLDIGTRIFSSVITKVCCGPVVLNIVPVELRQKTVLRAAVFWNQRHHTEP